MTVFACSAVHSAFHPLWALCELYAIFLCHLQFRGCKSCNAFQDLAHIISRLHRHWCTSHHQPTGVIESYGIANHEKEVFQMLFETVNRLS